MPRRHIIITLAVVVSALLMFAVYSYRTSTAAKLANYRALLAKDSNNLFYTYQPDAVHIFDGQQIESGPSGFRKNVLLEEELLRNPSFDPKNSYKVAVFGSWTAASLGVKKHATLNSYLNLLANTVFQNELILFFDYTVGGNNLEMMTNLIEAKLADQPFDAAVVYIEPKDLVYDVDYFANTDDLKMSRIYSDVNWPKTHALLKKLRGDINSKFNVDIIPVLSPVSEQDAGSYYSVIEAFSHFGFESCELNDRTAKEDEYRIDDFTWKDEVKLQDFSVQILQCMLRRKLRH